jgi:hypothetical protein
MVAVLLTLSYSGIKKGDFDNVTKTLQDVIDDLRQHIDCDTLLLGHSLENDLHALKVGASSSR